MKKIKLIAIIILLILLFQFTSPLVYAVENSIEENVVEEVVNDTTTKKEIEFASEDLKNYFLNTYDSDNDKIITDYDIAQITDLALQRYDFNCEETINLKGLEYATSLKSLSINIPCTNYSVLSNLDNLQSLKVYDTNSWTIEDYTAITEIQNLKILYLYDVDFTTMNLYNLPKTLEEITLYRCKTTSIENIKVFSNLTDLNITDNQAENTLQGLEGIASLSKLYSLVLSKDKITDISFLNTNKTIRFLYLDNNNITNIEILPTMSNLSFLNLNNNQIEDISPLESLTTVDFYAGRVAQKFNMDYSNISKGQKLEVPLPKTIQSCFDENSRFYAQDTTIEKNTETMSDFTISDDKTKIIIDTSKLSVGQIKDCLKVCGSSAVEGTTIEINYRVVSEADNQQEITFASDNIKNYLLENYDADEDKKITAYDMAQISTLDLSDWSITYGEITDLQGLEYCVNLKKIYLTSNYTNFSTLKDLQNLNEVKFWGTFASLEDYEAITQIPNLKNIHFDSTDFSTFSIYDLPVKLENLRLTYCKIVDIQNIDKFTNLTSLSIEWNQESNIQGLESINKLGKLIDLNLISCGGLEDISFLENNETIERLDISYNNVKNVDIISTMKKLSYINIYKNQIEDMSVFEEMNELLNNSYNFMQEFNVNAEIVKGQKVEIDLPETIQSCYNENSKFYLQNLSVDNYSEEKAASINEEGTKLIIDATNLQIGKKEERLTLTGSGKLNGTEININYTVLNEADNATEIEFASQHLKNYFLTNYDIDRDEKITAYDMAQITELYLPSVENYGEYESLKGIEYCIDLNKISIPEFYIDYYVIENLAQLETLNIDGNNIRSEDYQIITNLTNLKSLTMRYVDSTEFSIYDLPENITYLDLEYCNIDDISNIQQFTNLNSLIIDNMNYSKEIQGLEKINDLPNLQTLSLNFLNIKDINFLENNQKIERLNLRFNELTDISAISTFKNLKSIDIAYNRIEDFTALEQLDSSIRIEDCVQIITKEAQVIIGNDLEIELPQIIKNCFDENYKFYVSDGQLVDDSGGSNVDFTLNEDKTKITLDTKNLKLGEYTEYLTITGDGLLSGTTFNINYKVVKEADNQIEVQFENDTLKNFFLENYNVDNDDKITAYDMAQITELELPCIDEKTSLKPLEYCISLRSLTIPYNYTNFEMLLSLTELQTLDTNCYDISEEDYNIIGQMQNLESLRIRNVYLDGFSLNDLPKNIKELYLSSCKLDDISTISQFENLTCLNISCPQDESQMYGIENIASLTNLIELEISNSEIEDISFLQDNATIEKLDLYANKIKDITTISSMKKLKDLYISNNQIEDLSIIDHSDLLNTVSSISQDITITNIVIPKGETIEIDTPQIVKSCFDTNSSFYLRDLYTSIYAYEEEKAKIELNEDGTKITIDTTNMPIGQYHQQLGIYGNGLLSGTNIYLDFRVEEIADNTTEVEFGSEKIKNYILENYEIDGDNKITAYDMAQITNLSIDLDNREQQNLQGLEYCISLRELEINCYATNYEAIKGLTNLTKLEVSHEIDNINDYQAITQIPNLKSVSLQSIDFTIFNLYDIPSQIEEITLNSCEINDIQNINKFSNLKSLSINHGYDNMKISGLDAINELRNLTYLCLRGLHIEDIQFLNNNQSIEELELWNNNIKDVTPITTMNNLKRVALGSNNISDISVLENMDELIENSYGFNQRFNFNELIVNKGKKLEIDLPETVKTCFNSNSKFYVKDAKLMHSSENNSSNITLNSDKTKLIIDTTEQEIGLNSVYVYIEGEGRLSGTSINVEYTVTEPADNTKKIEFDNKELESYILNNHDFDADGKITAYDMAQIKSLNIRDIQVNSTKGLEYAKNLETLIIDVKYKNYDESIQYDFSQLSQLTKLKELTATGETYRIDTLQNLRQLEKLDIYLSYDTENSTKQMEQIKSLTNLKKLEISGGNISTIIQLKSLTSLEELWIEINPDKLNNIYEIANLKNLKNLYIDVYKSYGEEQKDIDYGFLKELTNLQILCIDDRNTTKLDATYISNLINLHSLSIEINKIINTQELSNLTNLTYLKLNSCQIDSIEFIRSLVKLTDIEMKNNFITDISPLEDINAHSMNFVNNPINPEEEQNSRIIELKKNNGYLMLTDYDKMQNLTFNNQKFKELLLNNYDINRDGEISIYEMEEIRYLYPNCLIENAQYLTNLYYISFNSLELNAEEQIKLIEQLNLLNDNVNISIDYINIQLGKLTAEQTEIDINAVCPILAEMQREGSRIYKGKLTLEEQYDDDNIADIKDEKIYPNKNYVGDVYYNLKATNDSNQISMCFKWQIVAEGDTTKEIAIEDSRLKQILLNNYDIDSDGKITEKDMLNITELYIANQGISSLRGIENAKNIRTLYAYNNNIKEIKSIVDLQKNGWFYLTNNEITDISYLANSKLDAPLNIFLDGNYINFAENSNNLKVLKANYAKDPNSEKSTLLNSTVCLQRYGKPEDKYMVVNLDSKIKNKLINYGLDTNKDGKLTRAELYNASNLEIEEIDLSNLVLTNISGLEYLNFYNINLSNNALVDITPLSKNKYLSSVNLSNNKIKDISCFANYNNFLWGKVDFSNNQIEDISSIKTWPVMCKDLYGDYSYGEPLFREIEINLSNNKIKDISVVKDFRHIKKLDLSYNKIENISKLAGYNFTCYKNEDGSVEEFLEDFEGIILNYNYISTTEPNNKKAINVFKNKNVTMQVNHQKQLAQNVFVDVKTTDWYYNAVQFVFESDIIKGANATQFKPNVNLTRGMLVTILWRMDGSPKVTTNTSFPDVKDTEYYSTPIKWAISKGIVSGYSSGKFGPNDNITREQLAVILRKYSKYKGKDVSSLANISSYKDANKVSSFAKEGVQWAIAKGIISGKDNGTRIDPQGSATRAEAAAMITNYCLKIK